MKKEMQFHMQQEKRGIRASPVEMCGLTAYATLLGEPTALIRLLEAIDKATI